GQRMREDLVLCQTMDHDVCAGCLETSPYLVRPLQSGLAVAARRAGLGPLLHRVHDALPRFTETALAVMRRVAPRPPAVRAAGMDARARGLRDVLDCVDVVLAPACFGRDRTIEFGVSATKARVLALGVLRAGA